MYPSLYSNYKKQRMQKSLGNGIMRDPITNGASVFDLMKLVADAINKLCDAREASLEIVEAYNKAILKCMTILQGPHYHDPTLVEAPPEKIEALLNISKRILGEFPDTSPEQVKTEMEEARQEIARMRKISADLDEVLGE